VEARTVVPLEQHAAYMTALEEASVQQNILLFTEFLAHLVNHALLHSVWSKQYFLLLQAAAQIITSDTSRQVGARKMASYM